jgi:hypothetical protein
VAPPANTKVTVGSQAYAPAMTDFRFFDMNGNGVYDANDRVVLDVDQNAFVTPADVRMSSTGGQTYGSRPTIGSSEAHAILGLALAGTLMWLDGATNPGQVDSGEPIALHIGGGALRLALGDVCLMTVGGCTAGAQRIGTTTAPTTGGTWTDVTTATNPGTLGYLDANNNNVYDVGDTLYLHFGAVPGNIANGDLVLAADGGASGSTVTAAGGALKVAFAPSYRALDVDGSGDYSVGDIVYDDHHGLATAAEPGDIRVSSGAGVTGFGKNLKDTDPDAVLALFNPTPSGPLFGFRDVDASTTLTPDEPVFLMPRATGCPLIGSDVNLSPGTGATTLTAGSFVAGALQTTCITVPGTPMFAYAPTGVFTSTSQLALDVNGNGALGVGDIWITGGTGGASGSRVTGAPTTATDLTLGVTTLASRPGPVDIRVVDASGDGVAASLETVVLDIDGDGFFTPGDVPLSGTGTSASSGGGGGGGGTVSTATTTATSTATATDTATDTATSTTTTASLPSLDDMNKAIAASLTVTHDADGNNVVKWAGQPGALGYQVWSHASPWAFVMSVDASMTTVVQKAPASTHYLVTAFTSEATKLTDINTQPVPGLGASPTGPAADGNAMEAGSTSASKTKGAIPGVEVVAGLAAVAVALALARRRLA